MSRKNKYFIVKVDNGREILSGLEISLLQQSGCKVKVIKEKKCPGKTLCSALIRK